MYLKDKKLLFTNETSVDKIVRTPRKIQKGKRNAVLAQISVTKM
jgi:hypothetical protein